MSGVKVPGGFTIVETMIFLAVSGVLLVVALNITNGKQAQVELTQDARDLETSINSVIGDVSKSYFPSKNNLICKINAFGDPQPQPGSNTQGTNQDCIFLGKVIQFSANRNSMRVITVVGLRQNSMNQDVTNFTDAKPVAVPLLDQTISLNTMKPIYMGWQPHQLCHPFPNQCNVANTYPTNSLGIFLSFPGSVTGNVVGSGFVYLMPLRIPGGPAPDISTGTDSDTNNAIKTQLKLTSPYINQGYFGVCFKTNNDTPVGMLLTGSGNNGGLAEAHVVIAQSPQFISDALTGDRSSTIKASCS